MLAAFSVTPIGRNESVGGVVAEAVRIVRDSGLPNETNAMFTNIEGEWEQVMDVIRASIETAARSAPRVSVMIKLDYRPAAATGRLQSDVQSIEARLRAPSA